jgi:two-component system, cell cycle response regulator
LDLHAWAEVNVEAMTIERRRSKPAVALLTTGDTEALGNLLRCRHDVRVANSADELLHWMRTDTVDAAIVDVDSACTKLWVTAAKDPDAGVPVVVVADATREMEATRAIELGAHDFLLRPLRRLEVITRVDRAVRAARERAMLRALADTDALTGLANFRALSQRLEQEVRRSERYGYPLAVVMLDLDHLKALNDNFGHEEGNRAIVALADHLRRNLRDADFAARFGGDEFVVIMPYQTADDAAVFAERVRQSLSSVRLQLAGDRLSPVQLSISAGVVATRVLDECPTRTTCWRKPMRPSTKPNGPAATGSPSRPPRPPNRTRF